MYNNSLDWRRFSSGTRNFVLEGMWVCPFPSERANQRRYHTIIIFMALQKIAQPQPVSHFNTEILLLCFSSVQFSRSIVSDSLQPHGLQHTRRPCPSPTPRACSSSCPFSRWYQPTISSSVIPFFSCLNLSRHQGQGPWKAPGEEKRRVGNGSWVNWRNDCEWGSWERGLRTSPEAKAFEISICP